MFQDVMFFFPSTSNCWLADVNICLLIPIKPVSRLFPVVSSDCVITSKNPHHNWVGKRSRQAFSVDLVQLCSSTQDQIASFSPDQVPLNSAYVAGMHPYCTHTKVGALWHGLLHVFNKTKLPDVSATKLDTVRHILLDKQRYQNIGQTWNGVTATYTHTRTLHYQSATLAIVPSWVLATLFCGDTVGWPPDLSGEVG